MKNKKLLRVQRVIEVYRKGTDDVLEEIDISHIPLEQLLKIFEPYERGDPLLYDPYDINEEQLVKLNSYLQNSITYDSSKYDYNLASFGVYIDTDTGRILE
ncbi:MAG: hypothetical protein ACM3VS_10075 [Candidatus Dadabacteria bacterium]